MHHGLENGHHRERRGTQEHPGTRAGESTSVNTVGTGGSNWKSLPTPSPPRPPRSRRGVLGLAFPLAPLRVREPTDHARGSPRPRARVPAPRPPAPP